MPHYYCGVLAGSGLGRVGLVFGVGAFVAAGLGGGGGGSFTFTGRDGEGTGGALRLLLSFALALVFSLMFAFSFALTVGVAELSALTLGLALAFEFTAELVIAPPTGIPASVFPVAGCTGSKGWLLGSATIDGPCGVLGD